MIHRHLSLLIVALLLLATPAAAQSTGEKCTGAPENTICAGPILVTDRLSWSTSDGATAGDAQALEYRMRVDADPTLIILAGVTCTGAKPYACQAPIPVALLSAVNVIGIHTVTLRVLMNGVEGPTSIPFAITPPAGCPDGTTAANAAVLRAVGSFIGERSQFSTTNHAKRLAQLRLWGWDVAWQRVQYAPPTSTTSSDGGYWYITAFCTGVPK